MQHLTPSPEQAAIVRAITAGHQVVIDSTAGSGKSTTMLFAALAAPTRRFLLVTYNATLKVETRERVTAAGIQNLEVHSYHSLAVRYYGSHCYDDRGIQDVLDRNLVSRLPLAWDTIIMDEIQDMRPLYYRLMRKLVREVGTPRPQLVFVGDVFQTVYGFLGADERFLSMAPRLWSTEAGAGAGAGATWSHLGIHTSYRISGPIANFINRHMLGYERMRIPESRREGAPVMYMHVGSYSTLPSSYLIRGIKAGVFRPEDIFVLAASIRPSMNALKKKPIHCLENELVRAGIPCFVPLSNEEKMDEDVIRGKVVFSSFHQAKGLERKIVMVHGFDSSYFEYYAPDMAPDQCPSTLYVAATRAREQLILVHNCAKPALPFIHDLHMIPETTLFIRDPKMKPRRNEFLDADETTASTTAAAQRIKPKSITELTRHLKFDDVDALMNCLDIRRERLKEAPIVRLKDKVVGVDPRLMEAVYDLNGIAIPMMFEWTRSRTSVVVDEVKRRQHLTEVQTQARIKQVLRQMEAAAVPGPDTFLFMANVYSCLTSGYTHKINQIPRYNWLTRPQCVTLLKEFDALGLSPSNVHMEVPIASVPIQGWSLIGRVDMWDIDQRTVWEIKCCHEITYEAIFQLALYAWTMENLFPEPKGVDYGHASLVDTMVERTYGYLDAERKATAAATATVTADAESVTPPERGRYDEVLTPPFRRRYKLINLLTRETVEVIYNDGLAAFVERLVHLKCSPTPTLDDEAFYEKMTSLPGLTLPLVN